MNKRRRRDSIKVKKPQEFPRSFLPTGNFQSIPTVFYIGLERDVKGYTMNYSYKTA